MGWQTVNYRERDEDTTPGRLLNRGFWLHNVPRVILLCRLLGHRPVVDGVDYGHRPGGPRSRWVCCDRCGIRPEPQGSLDPERYRIDEPYTGPWGPPLPATHRERARAVENLKDAHYPPGPWPSSPSGSVGGQLLLGRGYSGIGFSVKIGNPGSEQVTAASVHLQPLGSLYLHTERHGRWLQRRLNPHGKESRVIEVGVDTSIVRSGGLIRWRLWADRDGYSRTQRQPAWRDSSRHICPAEWLLGPMDIQRSDVGDPVIVTVRMPHGDDHQVTLRLQQVRAGRTHGRKSQRWEVEWDCPGGIPTRNHSDSRITGGHVPVSPADVRHRGWQHTAAAALASQMTARRLGFWVPEKDAQTAS